MRYIKLHYSDFELFDINWTELNLNFYSNHKDAFRQMWKEQGKEFWLRYLLTYRSFSTHHGFIGRTAPTFPHFSELVDFIFIQMHEIFVDGAFCSVRQLIEDISLFTQHRHLVGGLKYTSRAKDPFFMQHTRDCYRRLFGNPDDKECYARVILFPVYEHFVISTFTCLRRWLSAPEANPDDTSYWVPPPPAPEFFNVEPKKKKKGEKKPRFRTTTVPPNADFAMVEIRPFFDAEMNKGKPSGPQFVKDWPADRDPRFCEPPNPLYDPSACRDTDWRNKLDVVLYLRFADYVAQTRGRQYRHVLESMEEENIFNDNVMQRIRGIKVKSSDDAVEQSDSSRSCSTTTSTVTSSSSSDSQPSLIRAASVTDQPDNVANKTDSKERDKNTAVVSAGTTSASNSSVTPSEGSSAGRDGSEKGARGDARAKAETNAVSASSSADKQTSTELLRTCARCHKQESTLHEFKKCKKCKEQCIKDSKYYCGRECQLQDWADCHRLEHRAFQRSSAAVASTD